MWELFNLVGVGFILPFVGKEDVRHSYAVGVPTAPQRLLYSGLGFVPARARIQQAVGAPPPVIPGL